MHRLRRLKFWALAAVVVMAAGCAAVPPSSTSSASSSWSTDASATALGQNPSAIQQGPLATPPDAAQIARDDAMEMQAAKQATDHADVLYTNIWQRIRAGFAIPDMDGPAMVPYVNQAVQWYSTRPDYVARMTERSRKYLYYIVQEVERRHLPTELALLPFVESAFNPDAMSSAKASGMWQFIPSTGKHFKLKQTMFQDDRRDVMASTKAALDYLTKLHTMFGNWQLALAAYNWGEGGVQRAMTYNQAKGLPVSYGALNMPIETRNYYPKLQAVKDIIADPAKYGINLPDVPDHPYFKPVTITQDIDVDLAAKLANMTVREFRSLNPSYNKPVILAATKPQILLPYDNATAFEQAVADYRGALSTWTTYRVPVTATPFQLARNLHLTEATLRDVNNIPLRTLVKAGSTLLIPKPPQDDRNVSRHAVENAVLALAPDIPPGRRQRLIAGPNDTPFTVAHRYGLSPAEVAQWNHIAEGGRFRPRSIIIVYSRRPVFKQHELILAQRDKRRIVRVADRRKITRTTKRSLRYSIHTSFRHDLKVAQR
jgi:membrane-bound lytic murein transglycosylase D